MVGMAHCEEEYDSRISKTRKPFVKKKTKKKQNIFTDYIKIKSKR